MVVSTPLKNMKVSWNDCSQYMEKKHVPNHQAVLNQPTSIGQRTVIGQKHIPFVSCQHVSQGYIMPNEAGGFEHCSVFVLFLQCARSELSWPNAQRQPQCSPSHHSPKFDSFGRFGKCPFPQWIPYKHTFTCIIYVYIMSNDCVSFKSKEYRHNSPTMYMFN